MLLRLGFETSMHHAHADEDRLAAMSIATLDAYRRFLLRVWGFEMPVERAMLQVPEVDSGFIENSCRSARLRADLHALGYTDQVLTIQPTLANVNVRTGAQALGWLFVLERHSMLSGLICRQLQFVLGSQIEPSLQYFSACGETAGTRLRRFGEAVSLYARKFTPSAIIAGAQEAFRTQRQWYLSAPRPAEDLGSRAAG